MIDKIKKVFQKKSPQQGIKLIINSEKLETRVALLEDTSIEEYNIERTDAERIVGSVYKGRVTNIEPGIKAMFVDIGLERNAFLHFWDAIPEALGNGFEEVQRNNSKKNNRPQRISAKDIPSLYPVGSEILVQVTKGPIGNKGPRITTNIGLPGRYLVLMPRNEQFGISRKIDDPKERRRLRRIIEKMDVPEGIGIIMRTACQGKRARYFIRDYRYLLDKWNHIEDVKANAKAPACAFQEPGIVERTVRDFLTDEINEVVCDDSETVETMKKLVSKISPRSKRKIKLHDQPKHIFTTYGIQEQIENAFHRQVWLECGGYIVIDETEALISIDVNTGRNRGNKQNADKVLLETNVQAAKEVARQLRLRNMGGLIVVDFIDMRGRRDQYQVYKVMKERLRGDKAKTLVLPISQLGLMEMTRQRLNESLHSALYESCSHCAGRGRIKTTTTMSVEIQRSLFHVLQHPHRPRKDLVIVVHPDVLKRLRSEDDHLLVDIQRNHEARLTFKADPNAAREHYLILDAENNEKLAP